MVGLTDRMERLARDAELRNRLGRMSGQIAETELTIKTVTSNLADLFEDIIAGRKLTMNA